MTDDKDNTSKAAIEAVRSSVANLTAVQPPWNDSEQIGLIDQGNRLIGHLDEWLLDDEQKQMLSLQPLNQVILSAAAYLSDIGLMNGDGWAPISDQINISDDAADAIRSLYSRSAEMIRRHWHKLGIRDRQMADAIARVCLYTADEDQGQPTAAAYQAAFDETEANISLLAACLQLGTALDLGAVATQWRLYTRLPDVDRFAAEQVRQFYSVEEIGPHPYVSGTIRLKIRCRHPEVHRALKHHERSVQQLLEDLNQRVRPRFLFSDVIYEIESVGYTPIDLKFSVDSSAGLKLFMGNRLYADKRVFLRELIQNAVDACNYRLWVDETYSPGISITFNDDISVIKVRDNGIGMTRQWFEKYFLAIGISFYQSNEIRDIDRNPRIDFGFISQFGIGFLSSFLVAEKIVIKTRKTSYPGLMITITGLRDYFDVRLLDESEPIGTEVTLHLKPSKMRYCRSVEFIGYLKTNIRFLKIPVHLTNEHGNAVTIGQEKLMYDTDGSPDTMFVAPLDFKDSEGYVLLRVKKQGATIHALESASGGVSVFQDGIFVTQDASLLPEGARSYVVARINLMGQDKCELSMDRNRIFWNGGQLQTLKKNIRHALVNVANELMASVQSQDVSVNTLNSIINHLSIFFEFSDVDDIMYQRLCEPLRKVVAKRFRDFVRIHFAHALKTVGVVEADGYDETWQQQIIASFARRKTRRKN